MGVSGAGKSTVAKELALKINGLYLDADDYHPKSNIDKMSQGLPLNDDDRWPWLNIFAENMAKQEGIVIGACSALTKVYRDYLTESAQEPILFIHLSGDKKLISDRMSKRKNHFMPISQLDNQLMTLEIPDNSELALIVDISQSTRKIIEEIQHKISFF